MQHEQNIMTVERMMLSRAATSGRPLNGSLELLPLCNMNCNMCYIRLSPEEMQKRGKLHTVDEWICLAREMERAGVLFLLLTGGEPLLFQDFRRLYQELHQMGMILTINTNGTLLDEDWADFFGKYRPRRINITLYGKDDTAYKTLCHYPGGFEKALGAIRLLKEREVDVKINGSVTKNNRKDMEAIYRIGQKLDVPVHMDTYMLPGIYERGKPFEEQARMDPEEAAAAELEVMRTEWDRESFFAYVREMNRQLKEEKKIYPDRISCMSGNCSFTVNWQGEMRPCVTLEEPGVPVFEIGFETAWQVIRTRSKEFQMNPKCRECRLRPVCKTCVACAKLETGEYGGLPGYLCRYAKEYGRLLEEEWRKISPGY